MYKRQTSSDYAFTVATDVSGNVFIAGETNGALDGQTSAGGSDAFVTKYGPDGTKQWTRQLGTSSSDNEIAYSVATDASGNVFIAGSTFGALDGQASAGGIDAFVTKYGPDGTKQWTRQLGTSGTELAWGVAIDASGCLLYTSDAADE